ncbi:hypothetical protein L227DRAFT_583210 [Lentinus tigrinus ALCF2SS1-6]|uniref:Uncharacterized protein n=1 Tax=Lentinus tigrinus ALCF2SS1-6 TaxID=1328759 RepID=A0A5C2SPB0_9APHY|nr:hypothetical protein L227DRAFT_583210 [Lentinus tigrinus ALCF2SS1-6]
MDWDTDPESVSEAEGDNEGIFNDVGLGGGQAEDDDGSGYLSEGHAVEIKGLYFSRRLREWGHAYIVDRDALPRNPFGKWTKSRLEDEDLVQELHLHLQSIGLWISAMDIVHYMARTSIQERYGMKKDVTKYRQECYLPAWSELQPALRVWTEENISVSVHDLPASSHIRCSTSTFYQNDRRQVRWVHSSETAKPRPKGEGASLMVADFVSADYGWLASPDGTETAQVLFRAGKNREGYFTNEDILAQMRKAMAIVKKYYSNDDHVFVFDNATTHTKCPDGALSARAMPKGLARKEAGFWGPEVTATDANGKPKYKSDGTLQKIRVQMGNGRLPDGSPQSLYFPEGHEHAGQFKGMAVILRERGLVKESQLKAECPKFQCTPDRTDCCCRRVLYNQLDFVEVESFHPELNPIEPCWGRAKHTYRMLPPSSKDPELEANVLHSLGSVSIENICRYYNRSAQFADGYLKGLNGKQAAWAGKRYRGHRVMPTTLLRDLEQAKL